MNDIDSLPDGYAKTLHQKIGKNVKRLRKEAGLSQLKLAYALGYKSVSPISGAEIYYNKIHFNIENLYKIAHILDVDICELLKDTQIK